jgi:hypothetical protein
VDRDVVAPIRIKKEIEEICFQAGVNPKEVELITIEPDHVSFVMREVPVREGYLKQTIVRDYVWKDDVGDQEEDGQASDPG